MSEQTVKQGINPVTIRTPHGEKNALTLARMGVGIAPGPIHQFLTAAIINETTHEVKAFSVLDEATFINALGHLFPGGELATTHHITPAASEQFQPAALGQVVPSTIVLRLDVGDGENFKPTDEQRHRLWNEFRISVLTECSTRENPARRFLSVNFHSPTDMIERLPQILSRVEQIMKTESSPI